MPVKVLMVCLGNICRSPLAEGVLAGMTDPSVCEVDSAGTASYHLGKPPDQRSIRVAEAHGLDISRQRCRQFEVADFDRFDYIFAMDLENLDHIRRMARSNNDLKKVALLLQAGGFGEEEVPDPYYGGAEGFERVFSMISEACRRIRQDIIP
jgi:protein-tyrosine phosphatase